MTDLVLHPRSSRGRTRLASPGLLVSTTLVAVALFGLPIAGGVTGCASASTPRSGAGATTGGVSAAAAGVTDGKSGGNAVTTTATMVGGRCRGGACVCRKGGRDQAENPPPDADHKRFEIRLGGDGDSAALESPTLGRFTGGGVSESCFYIDVLPGTRHMVTFSAREARPEAGLSPRLSVAEYGPKGPFWYPVVEVRCEGAGGKCTRDAADAWGAEAKNRKRGRIDPCGSSVVTHLAWETSGGMGDRDSGLFRDFTVSFEMEVKKFATQFAPGSTECVPK